MKQPQPMFTVCLLKGQSETVNTFIACRDSLTDAHLHSMLQHCRVTVLITFTHLTPTVVAPSYCRIDISRVLFSCQAASSVSPQTSLAAFSLGLTLGGLSV